jgi:hypothetical protein
VLEATMKRAHEERASRRRLHAKEGLEMTSRIIAAIARGLGQDTREDKVHVHSGAYGRPYVCDDPHCTSPSLDVEGA